MDDDMSDDEDEAIEEKEEETGCPLTSKSAFKKLVIDTLESNELDQKRAAKMEILDFLNLLNVMNQAGIHFR